MQFGIFTVSDITQDPTTGRTPTEAERIQATLTIAKHAEEVGLDVFALGEHHNPPFWSSSPTTTLAYIAGQTSTLQLSTATTPHHDQRPGEARRGLRDAPARVGRSRRPDARAAATPARCTRGSARTSARACPWPSRTTSCCTASGARTSWTGRASSARPSRASPRRRARSTACRRSCGTARSAPPRSPSRPPSTATASSRTTSSGPRRTPSA